MEQEQLNSVVIPQEIYKTSYQIYARLYNLWSKGGNPHDYNELKHSEGIISIIANKVLLQTYRELGQLNFRCFKQKVNQVLPSALFDFSTSYRLIRHKLSEYNSALTLCTKNNKQLETIILDQMDDKVEAIVNTNLELKDLTDSEFRDMTYHRVIKVHSSFQNLWNNITNMDRIAFIFRHSIQGKNKLSIHIENIYKRLIQVGDPVIKNVFLYSEFEDDINHISIQFPLNEITSRTISSHTHNLIMSVNIPQQLEDLYKALKNEIDNCD